jgi:hypothetical protein
MLKSKLDNFIQKNGYLNTPFLPHLINVDQLITGPEAIPVPAALRSLHFRRRLGGRNLARRTGKGVGCQQVLIHKQGVVLIEWGFENLTSWVLY